MKVSDFNFDLPEELIAQHPLEKRDSSRLMVLNKETGEIEHKVFSDIIDYLNPGDTLILNNTRVMPARLIGEKEETGGKIEFLLLKRLEGDKWECLAKPGKTARIGRKFTFGNGQLKCEVVEVLETGNRVIEYIHEKLDDRERYQTVYSKEKGSAAAPTAGLHFTKDLLKKIEDKGVNVGYLTLHVGLGTFRPVKVDDINDHVMHSEFYQLSKETADLINKTKENGGRIISVGTTSTRTLETIGYENGKVRECSGWTDIFIYPGYKFKIVDNLITNFHLPESTLIMLVSALAGQEHVLNAYKTAVKDKYRFFSFGDAMFIK